MNRFERLVWKAVIVAVVLIIILFLWQEWGSFSIYKKINHDKLAAFATAVAAILTAATVYLLYKQIREQQKDRKLDSHPLIYAKPFYMSQTSTKVGVINVGKGIAKDIKAEFEFDRDRFKAEFGELDIKAAIRERVQAIDYILPLEMDGFTLPAAYTFVLLMFISNTAYRITEKYPLFVTIKYKDFYNEDFCVKYRINITDQQNSYTFYVEFERLDETNDGEGKVIK